MVLSLWLKRAEFTSRFSQDTAFDVIIQFYWRNDTQVSTVTSRLLLNKLQYLKFVKGFCTWFRLVSFGSSLLRRLSLENLLFWLFFNVECYFRARRRLMRIIEATFGTKMKKLIYFTTNFFLTSEVCSFDFRRASLPTTSCSFSVDRKILIFLNEVGFLICVD